MEKSRVELYELVWAKPMTHLPVPVTSARLICMAFSNKLKLVVFRLHH